MRILLVEDDRGLCDAVCYWLKAHQYEVDCCHDGNEADYYRKEGTFDCILLDRMLPGPDGISVLKRMRKEQDMTPVILITALGGLSDKLTGLDCGADDYLVKPFEFEELEARIRSVTRRSFGVRTDRSISYMDLTWHMEELSLTGPSHTVNLSKKEGMVLETLLQNQGKTLPRETIIARVWGLDHDIEENNLDNYIHFLRKRLKSAGSRVVIKNVWGVGYRLEGGNESGV